MSKPGPNRLRRPAKLSDHPLAAADAAATSLLRRSE